MKKVAAFVALPLILVACEPAKPTSDQIQRQQQEQLSMESTMQVGMPAITHFAEKRMMKMILELRDNPKLTTITYITDMNGKRHKVCDSVGFGLPYATQYTNPSRLAWSYQTGSGHYSDGVLPQADPNGLFSPAAAEGTWVLCLNPLDKNLAPVYIEDRVTVSTFPLPAVD